MIARRWSARATRDNAPRYARYFRQTLSAHLRELPGYRGATILERDAGEAIDIEVITWWESMAAIRGFAGDDVTTAVVSDEAHALLLYSGARVEHAEVTFDERLQGPR